MPEYIYQKPVRYTIEGAEMLKEVGDLPHLLLKIAVRGGHFPHRNAAAFARIQEGRTRINALYCEIDDDEAGLRAYFATDVPLRGTLLVGYENEVVAEFELERLKLTPARLDAGRIETRFHRVTREDPGIFRIQR